MFDSIKNLFSRGDGFFRVYLRRASIGKVKEAVNTHPESFYDGELIYITDCKSLAVWDEEAKDFHLIHLDQEAEMVFTRYYKGMKGI